MNFWEKFGGQKMSLTFVFLIFNHIVKSAEQMVTFRFFFFKGLGKAAHFWTAERISTT